MLPGVLIVKEVSGEAENVMALPAPIVTILAPESATAPLACENNTVPAAIVIGVDAVIVKPVDVKLSVPPEPIVGAALIVMAPGVLMVTEPVEADSADNVRALPLPLKATVVA